MCKDIDSTNHATKRVNSRYDLVSRTAYVIFASYASLNEVIQDVESFCLAIYYCFLKNQLKFKKCFAEIGKRKCLFGLANFVKRKATNRVIFTEKSFF